MLRGKGRPRFKAMKSHNCRGCPALEDGDLHTADPVDVFLVYNSAPRRPHRSQAPLPQILHSTQLPARKSYQHLLLLIEIKRLLSVGGSSWPPQSLTHPPSTTIRRGENTERYGNIAAAQGVIPRKRALTGSRLCSGSPGGHPVGELISSLSHRRQLGR